MSVYILSVLGVVIGGVFIDIIMPSGTINKYIKSIYGIFIVAVLLNPITNFLSKESNFELTYTNYEVDQDLYKYISTQRANATELDIKRALKMEGFEGVDININFSIENNTLNYNSCEVNLKNLVIATDKQHINKYEFIRSVVMEHANLTEEEIIFNE